MIDLLPAESSARSAAQSPRISFSHDFPNSGDGIPVDRRPLLESASDFHFFSGEPPLADDSHSRSADELFSNGRILPATLHRQKPPAVPHPAPVRETLRDIMKTPELGSHESSPNPPPGSSKAAAFWRFGRSSSLNSYGGSKRSLLGKLPLLHRSNSTGFSNQTQKKDHNKSTRKPKRTPPPPPPSSSTSSSSSVSSLPKPLPPAKKAGAGFAGGRVNPVLNVPPPYISAGTTNLFGFGYFFRQSRECTTTTSSKTRKKTTGS